ncbi:MAG: type IV pilus biogenesis protein PilM [Nocardioides sp.]|uniref:type IV pilus biogenesis protein PilM n=1 Tax=Nocardioides sp. TaxID=35761 RepID=UPI003F0018A4
MSSRSIVGLEIAERWVRGVELVRPGSRRPTVRAVGEVSLPPGAARDSEVLDSEAVSVALRQLWVRAGFGSKDVVVGVGNRRIIVREHVAPALPLSQIKQALRYQVQELLPVPVDQAVLDFYPVEPTRTASGEDGVLGLLVSAVTANIDGLLGAVTGAGLNVAGVDLAPFGLARAAARVAKPGVPTLVAHVGAATSWFVVVQDGVSRFVRIVPGGVPVARPEEQATGWDALARPDDLLAHAGANGVQPSALSPFPWAAGGADAASGTTVAGSGDPVRDFVAVFTETRDFYERAHPGKPVGQVLLTGEGATHPDLAARLDAVSDVDVVAFGLSDAFDVAAQPEPVQDRAALSAAGIAVGGEA